MKLSEKQMTALAACSEPNTVQGFKFWQRAGAYGGHVDGRVAHGIGLTLDSLRRLGFVDATNGHGWYATDAGRALLDSVDV